MHRKAGHRMSRRVRWRGLLLCPQLICLVHGRPATAPGSTACPPSCANNELLGLLDQFCSDKGTFWQSKHHYATAYHSIFGSIRDTVQSIAEIGIGEDTAPSVQAWATYFPNAHVYPIDIKTRREVAERARPNGATDRLIKHQAQFGCEYNRSMWDNPRIHLTLETDASDPKQLSTVALPEQLDIIIDDGSHKYFDQQKTLHTLWPRLRPGGFYVIEDMLVGALPWSRDHAKQVPTTNTACGSECFFPQRLAEHPFLFDRFGHLKGAAAPAVPLESQTKELLRKNDWFWVVTGVHQGGGLDASMIIRKAGPSLGQDVIVSAVPAAGISAQTGYQGSDSNRVDGGVLRDARKSLKAAQTLHARLLDQQTVLAMRLKRAEADAAMTNESPVVTTASNLPLYAMLVLSLMANALQWRRRTSPARIAK